MAVTFGLYKREPNYKKWGLALRNTHGYTVKWIERKSSQAHKIERAHGYSKQSSRTEVRWRRRGSVEERKRELSKHTGKSKREGYSI